MLAFGTEVLLTINFKSPVTDKSAKLLMCVGNKRKYTRVTREELLV